MYLLGFYLQISLIFNFTDPTHPAQPNLTTQSFQFSRRFLGAVQMTKAAPGRSYISARMFKFFFLLLAKISHLLGSEPCSALGIPRVRASLIYCQC